MQANYYGLSGFCNTYATFQLQTLLAVHRRSNCHHVTRCQPWHVLCNKFATSPQYPRDDIDLRYVLRTPAFGRRNRRFAMSSIIVYAIVTLWLLAMLPAVAAPFLHDRVTRGANVTPQPTTIPFRQQQSRSPVPETSVDLPAA
jgi:hypothetical protein